MNNAQPPDTVAPRQRREAPQSSNGDRGASRTRHAPLDGSAVASVGTISPDYWREYYEQVNAEGNPWLDCSNDRTHLQTISLALEAAGQVIGRRCLELGCGHGHLSRCLAVLEAKELVAADLVESMMTGYNERYPEVSWRCCDASEEEPLAALGDFDLVFALEVLQYLPIPTTLRRLAAQLTPGGRLVAIVPNAACPIVQRAMQRFAGNYVAADVTQIKDTLEALPSIDWWACRGLTFAEDQRVVPYTASPWTSDPQWAVPPNRLLFVAQAKRSANA